MAVENASVVRFPIPIWGAKEVTGKPDVPEGIRVQLPNGRIVRAGVGETYYGVPEVQLDQNGRPILVVNSILN